jgi:hypothetical protein
VDVLALADLRPRCGARRHCGVRGRARERAPLIRAAAWVLALAAVRINPAKISHAKPNEMISF